MGISLETPRGAVKDNAPRKFGRSGVSEHDQVVSLSMSFTFLEFLKASMMS